MKMAVCLPGPGLWDCSRCPGIRGHQVGEVPIAPEMIPFRAKCRGPGGWDPLLGTLGLVSSWLFTPSRVLGAQLVSAGFPASREQHTWEHRVNVGGSWGWNGGRGVYAPFSEATPLQPSLKLPGAQKHRPRKANFRVSAGAAWPVCPPGVRGEAGSSPYLAGASLGP